MNPHKERAKRRDRSGDTAVYHRDGWQCRMPDCVCPDGRRIDPGLRGTDDPWAPSIDHITPTAMGGGDHAGNKRAAHRQCNQEDGAYGSVPLPEPEPISQSVGERFPGLAAFLGKPGEPA